MYGKIVLGFRKYNYVPFGTGGDGETSANPAPEAGTATDSGTTCSRGWEAAVTFSFFDDCSAAVPFFDNCSPSPPRDVLVPFLRQPSLPEEGRVRALCQRALQSTAHPHQRRPSSKDASPAVSGTTRSCHPPRLGRNRAPGTQPSRWPAGASRRRRTARRGL